jgi:hypothetical protein
MKKVPNLGRISITSSVRFFVAVVVGDYDLQDKTLVFFPLLHFQSSFLIDDYYCNDDLTAPKD